MRRIIYNLLSGKNTKATYYVAAYLRKAMPAVIFRLLLPGVLRRARSRADIAYCRSRVDYYCRLSKPFTAQGEPICHLPKKGFPSTYYFDSLEILRWFPPRRRVSCDWGDVTYIPSVPSIVKSRPIAGDNANAVVLKLDKIRHFLFVNDHTPWAEKKNDAIFRGKVHSKEKRIRFFNLYFGNPRCNLGDTSRHGKTEWKTPKLTLHQQLQYKFILALEGNDVASNLKWVMSSQSIAVMPRPEFETWFMEGSLIPGYHYVEIRPDFSDLIEKMDYYIAHPDEALAIIRHANEYVAQFRDSRRERDIALMVMDKYFSLQQQQ